MKAAFLKIALCTLGLSTLGIMGCQTAPPTSSDRAALSSDVTDTMERMNDKDPGFRTFLHNAEGYVIFPSVGKGGIVAGGAYGRGEVYEHGRFVGYADTWQATVGAQIGGQSYSEVIAFDTPRALHRFEAGQFAVAADASAVIIKAGAAASASYENGVAIFADPNGGLMLEAAIGGQNFSFWPANATESVSEADIR